MEHQDTAAMVKDLRTRLGLTQEQFAARIGVTFGTVNRWENGHSRPQHLAVNRLREEDRKARTVGRAPGSETSGAR